MLFGLEGQNSVEIV